MTTVAYNWRRRGLGLIVAAAPFVLAVCSLIVALRADDGPPASLSMVIAVGFLLVAVWIGWLNVFGILGRLALSRWFGRNCGATFATYPLVGTVALAIALVLGFGSLLISLAALVLLPIDTGGAPWFLICTWRSREIWDGASAGTDLPD